MAKKKKTKDKARQKAKLRKQQVEQKGKLTKVSSEAAMDDLMSKKTFFKYMDKRYGFRIGMSPAELLRGGHMKEISILGEIHRTGMYLNAPGNNVFLNCRDMRALDTIKVDVSEIPSSKMALVKDNMDIYIEELPHLFIKQGKLELTFGKKVVTVVFSYKTKEEIEEFGPTDSEGGLVLSINNDGMVSGAHISYDGFGKPLEIDHGYTFDQFVRDSDNYLEDDFIKFGKDDIINMLTVLLYVNSLATAKIIKSNTSDKTYKKSDRTSKNSSGKVSEVYNGDCDREIIIPRIYKLVGTELHEYDNESKSYRKVMCRHSVCGHWRHYKSGKKIWISEFERGRGIRKSKPKVYRAKTVLVD